MNKVLKQDKKEFKIIEITEEEGFLLNSRKNNYEIKIFDEKLIKRLLKYETIIIYNPYSTRYGLVNLISSTLMRFNYKGKVVTKCVDDKFVDHATINEQLDSMKINIKHIISLLK